MSGLKDRLQRMKSSAGPSSMPLLDGGDVASADVWSNLQARIVSNEWGSFVLRERRYPLSTRHGIYELGGFFANAETISPLLASGKCTSSDRFLFLDTETTGLGVGAGNVPFMIGCGYYADDTFVVEQLLMRNPAEEAAMLAYLREKTAAFQVLVSYNGRTFDWPVLLNRYVLNRFKPPSTGIEHLDLLYPSRSLWKHTMESCRLGKVEEDQLGIVRRGDVPGSMAPVVYLRFLSAGDPELLKGVFHHNEIDIVTLAVLANHFCELLRGNADIRAMSAEEIFRTGLWLEKYGNSREAGRVMRHLFSLEDHRLRGVLLPLASYWKKKGETEAAARLWERSANLAGSADRAFVPLEPLIELAMYYEHKKRDIDKALFYAEEAMAIVKRRAGFSRSGTNRGAIPSARDALIADIDCRIKRLKRKQNAHLPLLF